jgi:FkbM family methyltransferase
MILTCTLKSRQTIVRSPATTTGRISSHSEPLDHRKHGGTAREANALISGLKREAAKRVKDQSPRLWLEFKMRFLPSHFEPELWLVPVFCDKNKIALDIGANMGDYSHYMAKFSREVIAFEPNPDLRNYLRRLLGNDCRLESVALSCENGSASLRFPEGDTGSATIEDANRLNETLDHTAVNLRNVQTRTLDSYGLTDIAMIKIDVEGHEEAVIAGAMETIRRSWPILLIESEDRHKPGAPRGLAMAMSELDYQAFYLKDRKLMDFDKLSDEDTNPNNFGSNTLRYINNFIFIPRSKSPLFETAQRLLSSR